MVMRSIQAFCYEVTHHREPDSRPDRRDHLHFRSSIAEFAISRIMVGSVETPPIVPGVVDMDILTLATGNLLQPAVLFFVLGILAGFAKSDLAIPEGVVKTMALYLMLCIGFRGGVEAAHAGFSSGFLASAVVAVLLSMGIPVIAFGLLNGFRRLDRGTRAATAAHYGSVSAVIWKSIFGHGEGDSVQIVTQTGALIIAGLLFVWIAGRHHVPLRFGNEVKQPLPEAT